MNFAVSNKKLYNLLLRGWFTTKGRASRKEYISRFLMMWILLYIPLLLSYYIDKLDDSRPNLIYVLAVIIFCLMVFSSFLALLQIFLVTHRRLHDLNASGWWQLITFIPLGQLMMIGFIFFKGTDGPNKYGDPPKY